MQNHFHCSLLLSTCYQVTSHQGGSRECVFICIHRQLLQGRGRDFGVGGPCVRSWQPPERRTRTPTDARFRLRNPPVPSGLRVTLAACGINGNGGVFFVFFIFKLEVFFLFLRFSYCYSITDVPLFPPSPSSAHPTLPPPPPVFLNYTKITARN